MKVYSNSQKCSKLLSSSYWHSGILSKTVTFSFSLKYSCFSAIQYIECPPTPRIKMIYNLGADDLGPETPNRLSYLTLTYPIFHYFHSRQNWHVNRQTHPILMSTSSSSHHEAYFKSNNLFWQPARSTWSKRLVKHGTLEGNVDEVDLHLLLTIGSLAPITFYILENSKALSRRGIN